MKARTASVLAWSMAALIGALTAVTMALTFLNRSHPGGDVRAQSPASLVVLVYATVGAFLVGRRLRVQVDLDSLAGELVGVVRETMQPAHVTLWLRSQEETR